MMMLKMMNPFGSVTDNIPGVGGGDKDDDEGMTKEEAAEQEKLRQEAIRQAERERREKYKRQEDEREGIRQSIRDKYGIEKKARDDFDEDEDDEDDEDGMGGGGSRRDQPDEDDPVAQAKAMAEAQLGNLKNVAGSAQEKCSIQ